MRNAFANRAIDFIKLVTEQDVPEKTPLQWFGLLVGPKSAIHTEHDHE